MSTRTADPYHDLDVIDARAPRFNQATVALGSLIALLTGWWPILALLAAQLAIGLRFGRRFCLPCLAYFELVQPRIGEGPIEDARPPRFANQVGLVVLSAASAAFLVGWPAVGAVLAGLVAGLALLAVLTGFCAGCQMYRLGARLRRIRARAFEAIEPGDLGLASVDHELVVAFSHPLCTDCRSLLDELHAAGTRVLAVDVRLRPEIARKYGVALVPTAVQVAPGGRVIRRIAG